MDINMRDVDWSRPPVLMRAVDGEGRSTDDLAAVVDGEVLFSMLDGSTRLVAWARALDARPVRVRS
jgi:hypothetical protein